MGPSHEYETQHENSFKVSYVQGGWLSSFVFQFTSTRFELKEAFSSLDISICPESLVNQNVACHITKGMRTLFLLHSAILRRTRVSAPEGCWYTPRWSKRIFLGAWSSRLVRSHGTSLSIPCGANSFLIWKKHGWPWTQASYIRMNSTLPFATQLDVRVELPPLGCSVFTGAFSSAPDLASGCLC